MTFLFHIELLEAEFDHHFFFFFFFISQIHLVTGLPLSVIQMNDHITVDSGFLGNHNLIPIHIIRCKGHFPKKPLSTVI